MPTSTRYSPEVRERAVRMVLEHEREYSSQWAAKCSIAEKIGCTGKTLRGWVRQAERDARRDHELHRVDTRAPEPLQHTPGAAPPSTSASFPSGDSMTVASP